MLKPRLTVLISMILAAVAIRLLPHPPNVNPIAAVALFGGASFADKRLAFLVPLSAMFLSDLVIGLYSHMEFVYASFAAIVGIGLLLRARRNAFAIGGAAIASSVLFFIVTNFGTWATQSMYPHTAAGLMTCYVAALPFFQNTLAGDLFFTAVLFGGFALLEKSFPILRERAEPAAITA
jgi:hypothetical protein